MCQQLMASLEEKRECVTSTATQQVIIMEVIMNSILILILLNQEGVASTRAKCYALLLITPSPPSPEFFLSLVKIRSSPYFTPPGRDSCLNLKMMLP